MIHRRIDGFQFRLFAFQKKKKVAPYSLFVFYVVPFVNVAYCCAASPPEEGASEGALRYASEAPESEADGSAPPVGRTLPLHATRMPAPGADALGAVVVESPAPLWLALIPDRYDPPPVIDVL